MSTEKMTIRVVAMACALPLMAATPAVAEPTVGLGLTVTFGGGTVDTGIGLRVFSDNRRGSTVGSLGLDYMFGQQNFRGTLGAAYLDRNGYVGIDLGYGFGTGQLDFGVGLGAVRTRSGVTGENGYNNGMPVIIIENGEQ